MNIDTLIVILISALVPCIVIAIVCEIRAEMRLIQSFPQKPCPACGVAFGESVRNANQKCSHRWTPAPGSRLDPRKCPSTTWVVVCTHCGVKTEYTLNGAQYHAPRGQSISLDDQAS